MSFAKSTTLAFLIAPIPSAAVMLLSDDGFSIESVELAFQVLLFYYWFALLSELFIGGPLLWMVCRRASVGWLPVLACGVLTGALVSLLVSSFDTGWVQVLLLYSLSGLLSSLLFWFVWRAGLQKIMGKSGSDYN